MCVKGLVVAFGFALLGGCEAHVEHDVEHGNVCIDLSPDGRTVVFSSADGDLFQFDLSANVATRLTNTEHIESCPSFSPDGRRVVYAASENETSPCSIYELMVATLETMRLTEGIDHHDFHPRYTLDGNRVVFARAYRHRPYSLGGWTWDDWDVCEMASDGGGLSRLTHEKYYQLDRIVPRSDQSLVFAAHTRNLEIPAGLYSLTANGQPTLLIPKHPGEDADVHAWASGPMVSPDGTSMAFTSDREKPFWYDVCVATGNDHVTCLVGMRSRYNRYPDFFPDGQRLIFLAGTRFNGGARPIYSLWEVSLTGQTREIASSDLFTHPERWLSMKNKVHPEKRTTPRADRETQRKNDP